MTAVYVPVYRMAVGYTVTFGRRWSLLEHLLLAELAIARRSVRYLAEASNLPDRLIIEALINLLRVGWIEVRTTEEGILFAATASGRRRACEEKLPESLQRRTRWISLCVDRLTGAWLRADELQLVQQSDLPESVLVLQPRISTYEKEDGSLRELVFLNPDEAFESFYPNFRSPSRLFARVEVEFDQVQGLPAYAPVRLRQSILDATPPTEPAVARPTVAEANFATPEMLADSISANDLVVGGPDHLDLFKECIQHAKTHVIIHSCFLHPKTVENLLPVLENAAARRNVRVDLLWGLRSDPEDPGSLRAITETEQVLSRLGPVARSRIQLSPFSSGSHAKVLLYDRAETGTWGTVLGSCNFLSSFFDSIEISARSRSRRLAIQVLGRLIATQLPAAGGWSPVARRLNRIWSSLQATAAGKYESGEHQITLLTDEDHYACVTRARDRAQEIIVAGCDLFGIAAETSVLTPMERAAELGRRVRLYYRRPSRFFLDDGRIPDIEAAHARGISLKQVAALHGKFLFWDQTDLVVSSFNWMSTVVQGARAKGAELGVLIHGPGLNAILTEKLAAASAGAITI